MKRSSFLFRVLTRQAVLVAVLMGYAGAAAPASLSGTAKTGNQPLANATVKLFQVGTAGYGSNGPLAGSTTTDAGGAWTISTISCSPANAQLFAIARSNNGAGPIRIIAFLGPCNVLPASVKINELTSIAAIWALQRFMSTNSGAIGAPPSNAKGLANAALNAANLASVTTGAIPGTALPAGATAPNDTINSLADIMAACDVTGGPPSTPCTNLFSAATPPGQSAPTDTLIAMLNVALFPVNNVSELFAIIGASPPYTPALASSPTDWSLVVNYVNGGLNGPTQIAADGSGNIWVANTGVDSISEFNGAGKPLSATGFTGGGLNIPFGLAINSIGNVWVSNEGNNSLSEFTSHGVPLSPAGGFTGGGLESPQFIAIDATNRVWVANCGDFCDASGSPSSVSIFSAAGAPLTAAGGIQGGGLNGASGITIDMNGNVWVANQGNNSLSQISSTGSVLSPSTGFTGGGLFGPFALAVSSLDFIWATDQLGNAISAFSDTGIPKTGSAGITGGGISAPLGIAVDSARNKWTANSTSVAEIDGTNAVASPSTGFVDPNNSAPFGIAIDASGNVWVTNTGNNSLSEFVGLAAPVKTPVIGPPTLP